MLFDNFPCVFATESTITFFNVGQGDCTIIKSPEKGILIIDAGSASTTQLNDMPEKGKLDILANKIFEHIFDVAENNNAENNNINFIITHSDSDHLNLIEGILNCILKKYPDIKIGIFFGGTKELYDTPIQQ